MNLSDFSKDYATKFNISERKAKRQLKYLEKEMFKKFILGISIKIYKIGIFSLKIREPKPFLNLQTGKQEVSERSYYLHFKAYTTIIEALKKKTVY